MKRLPAPQPSPERAEQLRAGAASHAARATAAVGQLAHELQVHQIELEMQNEELRRTQAELEAVRDRCVDLFDFAAVGYLSLNEDGAIIEANLTGAVLLGAERKRLLGSRFARHVAPADTDRWHHFVLGLPRSIESGRVELDLKSGADRSFHAQVDARRVARPDTAPTLRLTITDVTQLPRDEAELRLAATAFEAQEGMMITDTSGVIERVNSALTAMTGYSAAEAVGRNARLPQSGRHGSTFYAAMFDSVKRNGTWQGEVWNRRKDGELYAEWLTITAVPGDTPTKSRYVGTMHDISRRKAREEEIEKLAFHDPLTGLPNRRLMKDRLQQAMAVSARAQREGALMFIDLDHFKVINDTLGHDKGDQLLRQVAQRLSGCVRECDTVARPGDDEFVVMLAADLSDEPEAAAAQAKLVGEKILAALNQPFHISGQEYRSGASIGITLFSDHEVTLDDLLQRADQAMYEAKAAGRNTLRFFDTAVQQAMRERAQLEAELRLALAHGQMVLHYQPVFSGDGVLYGAEALLRWQHPLRGLLLPDAFIGFAEDTGLIQPLGRWVLEAACAQLEAWAAVPRTAGLALSVNVSARQWRDKQFVAQVLETLARSGAEPARLTLELTEGVMLDNVADTIDKMQTLRAVGLRFSLDDFGTGYSSLGYLKRLPLAQLKIDRSFVRDLTTSEQDAAITRSIVELARSLGLGVVAEGVETQAQRDLLAGWGCDAFQGDLFGPAAPAGALLKSK